MTSMPSFRPRLLGFVETLSLATLGTALLHTVASGQVKTLLHPLLQPLVAGGGIVLLGAAVLRAALAAPAAMADGPDPGGAELLRRLARDGFAAAAVVAAVACAPGSFSSLALANRVAADPAAVLKNRAPAEENAPAWATDPSGAIRLETVDLLMAAEHPETVKELEGRKVRFIGQYVPGGAEGFKITRFLMFCCAADAQPVSVGVAAAPGAEGAALALDKMAWVEVAGTVHFQEEVPGRETPRVTAQEINPIPEPANKFLY